MNSRPSPDDFSSVRPTASTMPVDAIRIDSDRLRRDLGNIEELAQNIAIVGLLHRIVVTADSRLVVGARRLAAVKLLGWKEIPVTIMVEQ
jgi:ParB family transcriptional regulator, chromosome partitioning protein